MFDSLPEGFRPFLGPECVICGYEVPVQKIGFVRGDKVLCIYCVAEIKGQDPDKLEADSPRGS